MKKLVYSSLLGLALLNIQAASALDEFDVPVSKRTVEAVKKKAWDDEHVTLVGNIERHLYDDKYLFKDNTGRICLEIDYDDHITINGNIRVFSPEVLNTIKNRKVRVSGKFDKEFTFQKGCEKEKIDVYSIEIIGANSAPAADVNAKAAQDINY
ncbi:YgiW/YdeI family stress tolerance OB fold protein [Pigmentibacter ruber]|nr:hypothetical protein GTC16762_02540 [Pigmentibacter ruber]